jgi:hypothetical protein
MKIQLVLSGTYLFKGKVFQRKDAQGKTLTYTVSKAVGDYLLEQRSERDVPYFRLVQEDTPAVVPASKRVEKGGIPQPEDAPADDSADAPADDEAVSADDVADDGEEEEEPVAL